MDSLDLRSHRFRAEREADWSKLESFLDLFERGRGAQLSDDDVVAMPVLYRATLSSLTTARAVSLDQNLIAYLESLCTRAYFCVYGPRTTLWERVVAFFARDWAVATRAIWVETVVAAIIGLLGVVVAFVLVSAGSEWFFDFIPAALAGGRDPDATTAALQHSLAGTHDAQGLTVFTSFLFTHNSEIAMLAFALGFACCLPTAFLLFTNGLTLGALFAVFVRHGLGVEFGGWVLIHGVTELFAVTLAGAAGFHVGWALAFPGNNTRLEAVKSAGRVAANVMAGVVVMLLVAGLLEGFGRQLITSTALRYAVAMATGAGWLFFFYYRTGERFEHTPNI